MYDIYENGTLIQTTEYPQWQNYDGKVQSFYCTDEENARAILVTSDDEGDSFYANIEGKAGFGWLTRTVQVIKRES